MFVELFYFEWNTLKYLSAYTKLNIAILHIPTISNEYKSPNEKNDKASNIGIEKYQYLLSSPISIAVYKKNNRAITLCTIPYSI